LKTEAIFLVQKMILQISQKSEISSSIDFLYFFYHILIQRTASIVHWFQRYKRFRPDYTIPLDSTEIILD
jgi:hypothetical protein